MRHKLLYALSLPVLGLSLAAAAHATPISAGIYTLTNATVTASGNNTTYALTGTVTINNLGFVSAADITLDDSALSDPVFNNAYNSSGPSGNPATDYAYISGSDGQIVLYYLLSPDGSGNIDLCIASASNCGSGSVSYSQIYVLSAFNYQSANLNAGTLDAGSTSVTPEPSTLVLLGTGILGLAAVARRRFVKI